MENGRYSVGTNGNQLYLTKLLLVFKAVIHMNISMNAPIHGCVNLEDM